MPTKEEQEWFKNKAEEIEKAVAERVKKNEEERIEKIEQIKEEQLKNKATANKKTVENNKMTCDEKYTAVIDYFNNNLIRDPKYRVPAIDVLKKMKHDTGIKLLSYQFIDILRKDGKFLQKREKYYIFNYRPVDDNSGIFKRINND